MENIAAKTLTAPPVLYPKHWFRYTCLAIGPLLFILVAFTGIIPGDDTVKKVIGIACWILFWWITEPVSIPVTALLPLVLFPFLGVMDIATTAVNYANPIIFLFMAGFIFALAMEKHQLHLRIALHIIKFVGTESNKIVLGFMISTAFVSMWVNNTAAALLMLPIATAVLKLTEQEFLKRNLHKEYRHFAVSLLLGLAYCATIGGITTIIGTPVNLVLVGYLKEMYTLDLSFTGWFIVGFPLGVVMLVITYFVLVKLLFRVSIKSIPGIAEVIGDRIKALGPMSYQEYVVTFVFFFTAVGWILRTSLITWFGLPFLNDTIIGMTGALMLFLVPDKSDEGGFLFDWHSMQKLSWGILLLIGGGFALAKALENAGIIKVIGDAIASASNNNYTFLLVALIGAVLVLKLFIANTALATITLPMVFGIANSTGIDPILLAAPVTFAASFAFMLPMSTPPNALIFNTNQVKIKDMLLAGSILTVVGYILLILVSGFYQWMII